MRSFTSSVRALFFSAISICAVLGISAALDVSPAHASPIYITASTDYAAFNYSRATSAIGPNSMFGASAAVGYQAWPNLAVELGYAGFWTKDSALNALKVKQPVNASVQGGTLDAVLKLPFTDRFALLGDAGISYRVGDLTQATTSVRGWAWGWRLGGGAEYALTDAISWRLMGWYDQSDYGAMDGALGASTGFALHI
ncbi:MAG: outer membrane beta-barrel protein [Alphaproteobacteria bacterium]|nr:outer membrane beta-barrel protein [Alphaproteobacteria bacterium]